MEQTNQIQTKSKKIKLDFKDSKYATGRRKRSIAKVWVKKGSGNIHVNGLKMNEYFKRPVHQIIVNRPLEISEVASNYDVKCSVKGGGLSGQAGAIILGISKALISHDENLTDAIKKIQKEAVLQTLSLLLLQAFYTMSQLQYFLPHIRQATYLISLQDFHCHWFVLKNVFQHHFPEGRTL